MITLGTGYHEALEHIEKALAWLQDVNQETIGLEDRIKVARAEIAEALECLKS